MICFFNGQNLFLNSKKGFFILLFSSQKLQNISNFLKHKKLIFNILKITNRFILKKSINLKIFTL